MTTSAISVYSINISGFVQNGWVNTAQGWLQPQGGLMMQASTTMTVNLPALTAPQACHAYRPQQSGLPCQACGFEYQEHPEYLVDLLLEMRRKLAA
jgi:hypothetical protein